MKEYDIAIKKYVARIKDDLTLLETVKLNPIYKWEINWKDLSTVTEITSRNRNWSSIPIFKMLLQQRDVPAIYYFSVESKHSKEVFEAFVKCKKDSSIIRLSKGVKADGFYNISHVPKIFKNSACIYVGSKKRDLHGRLIEHLGLVQSGRIGSLYLSQILKEVPVKPTIAFNYILLDKKYISITEHIESIVQDHLKPFIGKRALPVQK